MRISYYHKLIILTIAVFRTTFCFAQSDLQSDEKFKDQNRWEGVISKNVSGSFRLLSLVSAKPESYSSNDTLNVSFFMPTTGQAVIRANKIIQNNSNYRMRVENESWESGWQTFKPWPVKTVLLSNNVHARNLGVQIKLASSTYLPSLVFKSNQHFIEQIDKYTVHFYTPANISTIGYKVYRKGETEAVDTGELYEIDATSSFNLVLNLTNQHEGFFTLDCKILWISGKSSKYQIEFYHMPNVY